MSWIPNSIIDLLHFQDTSDVNSVPCFHVLYSIKESSVQCLVVYESDVGTDLNVTGLYQDYCAFGYDNNSTTNQNHMAMCSSKCLEFTSSLFPSQYINIAPNITVLSLTSTTCDSKSELIMCMKFYTMHIILWCFLPILLHILT